MMSGNLIDVFDRINLEPGLPAYLNKICDFIIDRTITRKRIDEILFSYQISVDVAKIEFLHLIFAYIKVALEDGVLSSEEKAGIRYLKILFRIQPGDFYLHNKFDVEETIKYHLSKIYSDNLVTEEEAEFKSGMQEIFDLSFDQMNNYSKIKATVSLQKGADAKDLDVFFTYNEYFKLKSKGSSY